MTTDTVTAAMWLHILERRTAMSANELAFLCQCTRDKADRLLYTMTANGMLRGARMAGRKNGKGYTVDTTCVIPRGLTLDRVMAAVAELPLAPSPQPKPSAPPPAPEQSLPARGKLGHIGRVSSVFAMTSHST